MFNTTLSQIGTSVQKSNKKSSYLSDVGTLAADAGIPFAGTITNILTTILKNQNPDTHWEGWEKQERDRGLPLGTSAQHWTINDGDNPRSEAINIIRWAERHGIQTLVNYSTWFKRDITLQNVKDKLIRNGFQNEASQLNGVSLIDGIFSTVKSQSFGNNFNGQSNMMDLLKKFFWIPLGLLIWYFVKNKKLVK